MQKFAKGMLIGGLVGAAGLTYAMSDRKTRKRIMKDGKKMLGKAEDLAQKMDII